MNEFERTHYSDDLYSAVGRTLTIATRFENNCKSLSLLLGMKSNKNFLSDDIEFNKLIKKLINQKLFDDINTISGNSKELSSILNLAREARNRIAHELTIGLDCLLDTLPKEKLCNLEADMNDIINKIAEGDLVTSFLITKLTNEVLPNNDFLTNYKDNIVQWVIDMEDT